MQIKKEEDASMNSQKRTVNNISYYFIGVMFIVCSLMLGGCSKKNDNPASSNINVNSQISFNINGGDFSNQKFSINNSGSSGAAYITDQSVTIGTIGGKSGDQNLSVMLAFPGKSTGSFSWDNSSSYSGIALTIGGVTYSGISSEGTTNVTQYGGVGSTIKGTFSGKVYGVSGTKVDTMQISGGQFTMVRLKDQSSAQSKILQ